MEITLYSFIPNLALPFAYCMPGNKRVMPELQVEWLTHSWKLGSCYFNLSLSNKVTVQLTNRSFQHVKKGLPIYKKIQSLNLYVLQICSFSFVLEYSPRNIFFYTHHKCQHLITFEIFAFRLILPSCFFESMCKELIKARLENREY